MRTAETIDEEVRKIIEEAYTVAKDILLKHKESLGKLARLLLEKEVIFKEDLEAIFGFRPGEESPEEKKEDVEKRINEKVAEQEKKESEATAPADKSSEEESKDSNTDKKRPLQINLDF